MKGLAVIKEAIQEAEVVEADFETDEDTVARLASLSPIEYDRVRRGEAKRMQVRAGSLDTMVEEVRGNRARTEPRAALFCDPEPWSCLVDGPELLDRLVGILRHHLVLPDGAAEAIALWIMFAHAHDSFDVSPILAVTSPTPECGKTTLMTLLGGLLPRALPASNITPAALFRAIEKWHPSLLIDEADTFLPGSDDLRGVLNSGHHRANASVIRTTGEDHEPKQFRTWAPKAIALIGKLPATLASRAIHVELRRKTASERTEPLRLDRLERLEPLHRQAARWAADHAQVLRHQDPEVPPALYGRAADNWRPLLAIAGVSDGAWPATARRIAEKFGGRRDEQTAGIMLLQDIQGIFAERGADKIASGDLAEALSTLEERPWPEWQSGRPITKRQIAKLLEPFGVRPGTVRLPSGTIKGYKHESFEDAFRRYLEPQTVTPSQAMKIGSLEKASAPFEGVQVTDGLPKSLAEIKCCDDVTAGPHGSWEEVL